MSKGYAGLSSLIATLNSSKSASSGLDLAGFVSTLANDNGHLASISGSAGSTLGTKSLGVNDSRKLSSISFGKPSSNVTSTPVSNGSTWTNLLSSAASGNLSSALTGGFGGFAGLGGLISGIASLFGGSSSAPPPLQLFSLPNSIQSTVTVGSTINGGSATSPSHSTPVYASSGGANGSPATQYSSATGAKSSTTNQAHASMDTSAIAAAVKNALLNSNTLGDVIAEM